MQTHENKKFKTTCGPRQLTKIKKALLRLRSAETTTVELTDFGEMQTCEPFSQEVLNPRAVELLTEVGDRFGWEASRENAAELAKALEAAAVEALAVAPRIDNRTTPEERAERERENQEQQEKVKAEAQAKEKREAEELASITEDTDPVERVRILKRGLYGKEISALLRKEYKRLGWGPSQISVKKKHYGSYSVNVKGPGVDLDLAKRMAMTLESVRRCEFSGDILSGGNTYVSFGWDYDYQKRCILAVMPNCREAVAEALASPGQIVECLGTEFYILDGYGQIGDQRYWAQDDRPEWLARAVVEARYKENAKESKAAKKAPAPVAESVGLREGFTIQEATNKRGQFWLVINAKRVEREEFLRLRDSAKAAGGWYSRAWGGTPGGFGFNTEAEAKAWAGGDGTPPKGPSKEPERLEALADKMQSEIDHKRSDLTQNPTPRRLRIKEGQRADADRLERGQEALRAIAAALRAGNLPEALGGFTSRAAVMRDLNNPALVALVDNAGEEARAERKKEQEKQKEIDTLRFAKIPGFFPTPRGIVDRMIEEADLKPGMRVLEPSAGIGSILEALPEGVHTEWIEPNSKLFDICRDRHPTKNHLWGFCETFEGMANLFEGKFDRVLMNPPFEKSQGFKHTLLATECLKPGGRVVSIIPPIQADKLAEALGDEFTLYVEPLPEGSFRGVESFRQTGVNVSLAVIDRIKPV